jgi:deoxyribodipyrimidine photo-lyase
VAWCFGKHDQAWKERPIFGKVRYMNAKGLEHKFDMAAYVERIEALERAAAEATP